MRSTALYLDPAHLSAVPPAHILDEAAAGRLGLDHRFLNALLTRREATIAAILAFVERNHDDDPIDLEPDLVALIRALNADQGIPFLLSLVQREPLEIPDDVIETLVQFGAAALEPLLTLYQGLAPADSAEVAFILASLSLRDERILRLLTGRLEHDPPDSVFLLGLYGDPSVRPMLERLLSDPEVSGSGLEREIREALENLEQPHARAASDNDQPFDIYSLYPEVAELPVNVLSDEERAGLFTHPTASVRAAVVRSFFNEEDLNRELVHQILALAQNDPDLHVRAQAWETLLNSTEEPDVLGAMLQKLRSPSLPAEERAGLVVGLSNEIDRKEVRTEIEQLYARGEMRAKALEAMWRSADPSFRDYFPRHLGDDDAEVRRNAIWGVGYFGIRSELDRLRRFFNDEELRADALFAYALAMPGETSRGRMKTLFSRVEEAASGLSEAEEELVKAALDQRLLLAGKQPFFSQ